MVESSTPSDTPSDPVDPIDEPAAAPDELSGDPDASSTAIGSSATTETASDISSTADAATRPDGDPPLEAFVAPDPAPEASPSPDPTQEAPAEPDPAAFFAPAPEPPAAEPAATEPPAPDPQPGPADDFPSTVVAATVNVPASDDIADGGGEWELLVAKVKDWTTSGQLQEQFSRYRGPIQALLLLVGLLVVLRLYGALLGAIESLPLVPGLLELAGLIWLTRFSLTRLVRSSDRQELIASLKQRWESFRGNA